MVEKIFDDHSKLIFCSMAVCFHSPVVFQLIFFINTQYDICIPDVKNKNQAIHQLINSFLNQYCKYHIIIARNSLNIVNRILSVSTIKKISRCPVTGHLLLIYSFGFSSIAFGLSMTESIFVSVSSIAGSSSFFVLIFTFRSSLSRLTFRSGSRP